MAQTSNRAKLLTGAMKCLQTKGYARTTARDIAKASGANLASIGYHYGSKEALLNAALIRSFEQWTEQILRRAAGENDRTPLEQLAASWKLMIDSFEDSRPLLVAFLEAMTQAQHAPELRAQLATFYDRIRTAIAGAVRANLGPGHERPEPDSEVIASLLIAVYDGLILQRLLDPAGTPDADQLATSLASILAGAMATANAKPRGNPRPATRRRVPADSHKQNRRAS